MASTDMISRMKNPNGAAAAPSAAPAPAVAAAKSAGFPSIPPPPSAVPPAAAPSAPATSAPAPAAAPSQSIIFPCPHNCGFGSDDVALLKTHATTMCPKRPGFVPPPPAATPPAPASTPPAIAAHTGVVPPDAPSRTTSPDDAANAEAAKKGKRASKKADVAEMPEPAIGRPIVYVKTYPRKGPRPVEALEWLQPICEAVAKELGFLEYRMGEYKDKGLLAARIREQLPSVPALVHVADPKGNDAEREFLAAVTPIAANIIDPLFVG